MSLERGRELPAMSKSELALGLLLGLLLKLKLKL
jgi:hypothetical protein